MLRASLLVAGTLVLTHAPPALAAHGPGRGLAGASRAALHARAEARRELRHARRALQVREERAGFALAMAAHFALGRQRIIAQVQRRIARASALEASGSGAGAPAAHDQRAARIEAWEAGVARLQERIGEHEARAAHLEASLAGEAQQLRAQIAALQARAR